MSDFIPTVTCTLKDYEGKKKSIARLEDKILNIQDRVKEYVDFVTSDGGRMISQSEIRVPMQELEDLAYSNKSVKEIIAENAVFLNN